MTTSEWLDLAWPLLAGGLLGLLFFTGLWWTVYRAARSSRVALWFLGSLLLRSSVALSGLYLVCGNHWPRWAAALLGFSLARLLVVSLTGRGRLPTEETSHAP
ncbi:ATP synthase subunit I [Castellaniella sp.]|uniref:ATP synthase subunit I n=1 Tax=Castellaniella sp. TaxID=1955812 RepID=UPI002AFE0A4C|nr:ATP synthase subunit I [Castellaniella sp.]